MAFNFDTPGFGPAYLEASEDEVTAIYNNLLVGITAQVPGSTPVANSVFILESGKGIFLLEPIQRTLIYNPQGLISLKRFFNAIISKK